MGAGIPVEKDTIIRQKTQCGRPEGGWLECSGANGYHSLR
jgi:hypothetical protein